MKRQKTNYFLALALGLVANTQAAQQTVSATFNQTIYSITYPDTVCLNQNFEMVIRVQNLLNTVRNLNAFVDMVPDPAQGVSFCPGLSFVSNTAPAVGNFDPNALSSFNLGGKGAWINLNNFPALGNLTVTTTIAANALGLQRFSANIFGQSTAPALLVSITVVNCGGEIVANPKCAKVCPCATHTFDATEGNSGTPPLSLVGVTQPDQGFVTVEGNTFTYHAPKRACSHRTSFTYTITDATQAQATATVTIVLKK